MPTGHSLHLSSTRTGRSNRQRTTLLALPHELLLKIATHVVALPGIFPGSTFISSKPHWRTVAGLATASRATRDVALRAWFTTLILKHEEDWDVVAVFAQVRFFVRELYVHSTAVSPTTSPSALLTFPALRAAHINAHNDVTFDPRSGYTYYTLLPQIPPGLKRLSITHAHAPDAERLEALGGDIEELRLGRCTLFDCATQGCSYWPAFPHDHDAYFSDDGVVDYSKSVAQDLTPLKNLRALHLGVYLTPYIALSTHQHQHHPTPPAPPHPNPALTLPPPLPVSTIPYAPAIHIHPPPAHHLQLLNHPNHRAPLHSPSLWSSPCESCQEQFGPATEVAERTACVILGGLLPGVSEISWAGYFERYGRGVSKWARKGDEWVHVRRA
ncbi:hypothetical protein BDV93DRAFT_590179 [Ceratobasidium sp. AG-I]|nr:hypothetical protein BDV93DRAFT_590179 [Ceratobasidium sp. AG-I]